VIDAVGLGHRPRRLAGMELRLPVLGRDSLLAVRFCDPALCETIRTAPRSGPVQAISAASLSNSSGRSVSVPTPRRVYYFDLRGVYFFRTDAHTKRLHPCLCLRGKRERKFALTIRRG
jgi:hypothetical protein